MRIGYFGNERDGYGTFTHIVSLLIGDEKDERVGISSFPDLVDAVISGKVDKGVIPTENFSLGGVNQSTDSIIHANGNFKITGKILMPVHHNLIAMKNPISLARIIKVVSFNQATPQCRNWLRNNLPWAEIDDSASSTAAAVRSLENYGEGTAAIGSLMSAEYYQRTVVVKNIHDNPKNATSFFILSHAEEERATGNDETSLIFIVPDLAGSLWRVLGFFAEEGINLSRIDSRPAQTKFGEYIFFVTIDGHRNDMKVESALKKLEEYAEFVKVLGSYPSLIKGG